MVRRLFFLILALQLLLPRAHLQAILCGGNASARCHGRRQNLPVQRQHRACKCCGCDDEPETETRSAPAKHKPPMPDRTAAFAARVKSRRPWRRRMFIFPIAVPSFNRFASRNKNG